MRILASLARRKSRAGRSRVLRLALMLALAGGCATALAHGPDEGIFADFHTSLGDFAVQLDFERAPRAVAGFVGLATGETGWLDAQTNLWRTPFYDGSIFHRVVKDGDGLGLAIQGGGRATITVNTNTGVATTNFLGPGYQMLETVANGLLHSNGVISMANSGPNTEGSQFFVTVTNMPVWDGAYTVFGHVVAGMSVVEAIAAVPVQGAGERPLEDIHLYAVAIRRVGPAAEAFGLHDQGVPVPESAPMRAYRENEDMVLEVELATQTRPLLFSQSPDMQTWDHVLMIPGLTFYTAPTQVLVNRSSFEALGDRYFFHASRIRYPVPITSPASHRGRTITFDWNSDPPLTYQVSFYPQGLGGTGWVVDGTNEPYPRLIFGDGWTRQAYSARLYFVDDLGREYQYSLGFNPGQPTNRFTGSWRPFEMGPWNPISGLFTMPE